MTAGSKCRSTAATAFPKPGCVDLNRSILEVYRGPSPQGYREVLTLRRGDSISPLAFPDLKLEVDAILG